VGTPPSVTLVRSMPAGSGTALPYAACALRAAATGGVTDGSLTCANWARSASMSSSADNVMVVLSSGSREHRRAACLRRVG